MRSKLKRQVWKMVLGCAAGLIAASACQRAPEGLNDPKQRLSDYISKSFSVKDYPGREELLKYLTGPAKARLAAWSEEQFRAAFLDSKRQFLKLAVDEVRAVSPQEVNITYDLSYVDQGRGHDAKVTNRKLCVMILEDGKWMIREVKSIKEMVEYRNEMSLP